MKRVKLKGDTPEKKLQEVERLLNRILPRMHKNVGMAVPPAVFSSLSTGWDSDGVIHQSMFATKGTLRKVYLLIESVPEGFNGLPVEIQLVKSDNSQVTQTVTCGRNLVEVDIQQSITPGMRIKVICKDTSVSVHNIWVAGAYDITLSSVQLQTELVNNLEELHERITTDSEVD